MRIAVVSDIHGNLPALEAVVHDLARRGVDHVINLGDSLSGPLLPRETAGFLMAQPWTHLAGNHERQILTLADGARGASDEYAHSQLTARELAWMASLRPAQAFDDEVFLCHGTPTSDLVYLLESVDGSRLRAATAVEIEERVGQCRAQVILCGHSHVPRAVRTRSRQLVVNPGSVGLQAYDTDHPSFHVVENGAPDARYAIVERDARGEWTAMLVAVPYDASAMAELARLRERPEWERALRTGYVQAA